MTLNAQNVQVSDARKKVMASMLVKYKFWSLADEDVGTIPEWDETLSSEELSILFELAKVAETHKGRRPGRRADAKGDRIGECSAVC